MDNETDDKIERSYLIASEEIAAGRWVAASLGERSVDEILISYWNPKTKAQVDAAFKFRTIQGKPCPWLEAAEDCWRGLAELAVDGFFHMLGGLDERNLGHVPMVGEVVGGLRTLGFVPGREGGPERKEEPRPRVSRLGLGLPPETREDRLRRAAELVGEASYILDRMTGRETPRGVEPVPSNDK